MATSSQTSTAWPLQDGLYRSPALTALGLVAGFTTRAEGSLAGSVFPQAEQDAARERLARRLGFREVARVRQVHGNTVVRATFVRPGPALPAPGAGAPVSEAAGRARAPHSQAPEADAMWTDEQGVLLGIAAADCVPVLVAVAPVGSSAGTGAGAPAGVSPGPGRTLIGAAHAGWEGTTKRVAQALVRELVRAGADAGALVASIGPSIGPCCYTVDEARASVIRERLGAAAGDALRAGDDRITFDLWAANAAQLAAAGVRTVELAGICTRCGGPDLWSYRSRAERGPQGTALAVLGRPV